VERLARDGQLVGYRHYGFLSFMDTLKENTVLGGPTVSVLIPTYNRAFFLPECLDSVLLQTLPPKEVIVINDGSTDNTKEVVERYKNRVQYIEKENGGKSTAVNLGISRATGEYVWIVDDDDVAFTDALERSVKILEHDRSVGFTYSSCCVASSRPEDGRMVPGPEDPLPDVPESEFFLRLMEQNFIRGSPAIVVRSSCYKEIGPYNTELIRSQDYEMLLRLSQRFRAARVSGATFYHRVHGGVRGSAKDMFFAAESGKKWRYYNQAIFRKLRLDLPLDGYLPRHSARQRLAPGDMRRAYLQRMTVMVAKGLYQEAVEDLGNVMHLPLECGPLSAEERNLLHRALDYQVSTDFMRSIRRLSHNPIGAQIQWEFTRDLYWRTLTAWKWGEYKHALQRARAAFCLNDIRSLARAFLYKLRVRP
jgi:glycosyltransferase involved in cell wall biosynthesis